MYTTFLQSYIKFFNKISNFSDSHDIAIKI